MDTTTITPTRFTSAATPRFAERKSVAPSAQENAALNSRQTEALLPTEMVPVGQDSTGKQDVVPSSTQQDQARLAEEAKKRAEKANAYLKAADTHLEFKVSEETGRVVISVVKSDTQEVVRQIPPDSLHRLSDRISQMRGLLFETTG